MKIFLDTASISQVKPWIATGLIDGITTNPSHLSKEKEQAKDIILQFCNLLPHGDISVEVTEQTPDAVYQQAESIAKLADNILVKIPCHASYYPIIKQLVQEGIRINSTLVFSTLQSIMMVKLGVEYISPFVGRLQDIDIDGIEIIEQVRYFMDSHYCKKTKILAASIRNVRHFHEAIMAGADAVTVPVEVFEKAITHPLTDQGIEKFLHDWKKLGIDRFP